MSDHELNVGGVVVYIDTKRRRCNALITAVHGEFPNLSGDWIPCINLLYVSEEDSKTDQYGRQIEHQSSCSHASCQNPVVGNCWYWLGEEIVIDEANVQTQR